MDTNIGKFALTFGSFKSTIAFRIEDQSITISKMLAFRPSKNLQFIQIFLLYKGRSKVSVLENLKTPLEGVYIIINPHSLTTLFDIFIFCLRIQLWFPEKIVDFLGWKTRENVMVLDYLAVDNFDFTRKIVKKTGVKLCQIREVSRKKY